MDSNKVIFLPLRRELPTRLTYALCAGIRIGPSGIYMEQNAWRLSCGNGLTGSNDSSQGKRVCRTQFMRREQPLRSLGVWVFCQEVSQSQASSWRHFIQRRHG